MSSTELVKSAISSGLSAKVIMKNSSCGLAVLKNSTTASRARSILLLMLPLMSKITPIETGASSLEKVLISCWSLPSKRLKFSRSRPVTSRFRGSVMVTGTSTMFTSTLMGLLWVLSAGSTSGAFGAGGWTRGWMWTSSVEVWARSGGAPHTATTRSTTRKTRAENCLRYSIGPTKSAPCREATRIPKRRAGRISPQPDTSTIAKKYCHLFVSNPYLLRIFFLLLLVGPGAGPSLLQFCVPFMAIISPFRAWRYDPERVPVQQAVTQPYDKITPAMQEHYYQASPYNLVRIILGKRLPGDGDAENVY